MLNVFGDSMVIAEKGKWLQRGGCLLPAILIVSSFVFQGCSQQITSASYAQKTSAADDVLIEGTVPEQTLPTVSLNRAGVDRYLPLVKKYSNTYGIDWTLVLAVIKQESRFNHEAVSDRGAYGLMQIMPITQIELADKLGVDEASSPRNNIKAGVYHLKSLYSYFHNVAEYDRMCLTLAAYNAGLGRIEDAQQIALYMGNDPKKWSSIKMALPFLSRKNYTLHSRIWADGCPPSGYFRNAKPTVDYVNSILTNYDHYSLALK
jgi:membrane-bound lytic murein transglycosylase F